MVAVMCIWIAFGINIISDKDKAEARQKLEESEQEVIEAVGEEWASIEVCDLVRWNDTGKICIVSKVVPGSGVELRDFYDWSENKHFPNFPIFIDPRLTKYVTLIKRAMNDIHPNTPSQEYLLALDKFMTQQFEK